MIARTARTVALLQLLALPAAAHPVAQGAMEILVRPDGIDVRARVSSEEAFVAEAFTAGASADGAATLDDVWKRHGEYLLVHLHVFADHAPLRGRVVKLTPPESTASTARLTYELHFDGAPEQQPPAAIELRQDVLNEIAFAPGNRWEATYIVRIEQPDRPAREGLLFTAQQPLEFACDWGAPASASGAPQLDAAAMAAAFVRHGIAHILSGYDHLLFIAGLVLAVVSVRDLIKVVTAFTLAHTITLTLAVLDVVRLPSHIVEPMIAASIVVVALQNLFAPARSRDWTRLAVAFGFGLFHGLGFAGGLLGAMEGMAGVAIFTAIAAFSIGVEIGHQLVALPIFLGLKAARTLGAGRGDPEWLPRWALRCGSAAICAAGMLYFVAALK